MTNRYSVLLAILGTTFFVEHVESAQKRPSATIAGKPFMTVASFDDAYKAFLAKVKASPKSKATLPCIGPLVIKDAISKFDEIVFSNGCSIQFDIADKSKTPFVALSANVWRFLDAGVGMYQIGFVPPPSSLDGPMGANGGNATSYSRDNHVQGGGHDGSPGAPGGPGGSGNFFDRPEALLLLVSKGIFDKSGPLKPGDIAKLNFTIDASGVAGGKGGKGGTGGRGGDGEGGTDGLLQSVHCHMGECQPDPPGCRINAGPGGIGGTPGQGGRGGKGADGGHAANIDIYAANDVTSGMGKWKMRLDGGDVGKAGEPGAPGDIGIPGDNGRVCGPPGVGRAGSLPTPVNLGTDGPGDTKGAAGKLNLHPGL